MDRKKKKVDIYGTLGPACCNLETLAAMFDEGMTGIRLNLSHTTLEEAADQLAIYQQAAEKAGVKAKLLIDMQGPELRVGNLSHPMELTEGQRCVLGCEEDPETDIPIPVIILDAWEKEPKNGNGQEILLDDGKILLTVERTVKENGRAGGKSRIQCRVQRGGCLKSRKSIAFSGFQFPIPAMTAQDLENISNALRYRVTGVMQPFVRSAEDLREVRTALDRAGAGQVRLFAKIENMSGVENLETFFPLADEIVIARGDLGNAMPLWELPRVQKQIEEKCNKAGKPFMVVTQLLSSMEHSQVPTRAEVSDIYNAVADGAASVMVTGETAVGEYPVDVIRYLARTAASFGGNE